MELIAVKESGWTISPTGVASPPKRLRNDGWRNLTPLFKYGFESVNRRMCAVCSVEGGRCLR